MTAALQASSIVKIHVVSAMSCRLSYFDRATSSSVGGTSLPVTMSHRALDHNTNSILLEQRK